MPARVHMSKKELNDLIEAGLFINLTLLFPLPKEGKSLTAPEKRSDFYYSAPVMAKWKASPTT